MSASDTAILVENLSKQYRIGERQARYRTIRETMVDVVKAPFRRTASLMRGESYGAAGLRQEIWALKDISFEVKSGEVLGIIGRNGSGKTTLLKVLSRITEPTEGGADIHGQVSSLLDVGTGMHPELTGRENVYLNGAILGMRRAETNHKFDQIVEFSGVEKFIDTPMKHYSSGMQVRLAFSIAAHLEPEILLVDEVLAVGDAEFQAKCLGKMEDVVKSGRTVLFVSHNMAAIMSLCPRGILLDAGEIKATGPMDGVVDTYLTESMSLERQVVFPEDRRHLDSGFRFLAVRVLDENGHPAGAMDLAKGFTLEMDYEVSQTIRRAYVSFELTDRAGACAFVSTDRDAEPINGGNVLSPGRYRASCFVPSTYLRSSSYFVSLECFTNEQMFDDIHNAIAIEVIDSGAAGLRSYQERPGAIAPILRWNRESIS